MAKIITTKQIVFMMGCAQPRYDKISAKISRKKVILKYFALIMLDIIIKKSGLFYFGLLLSF